MKNVNEKIGIGTAQWGTPYGISNQEGKTSESEALKIIKLAQQLGIALIDTAALYGEAEIILGKANINAFHVVTKTPKFFKKDVTDKDAKRLIDSCCNSIKRLNLASIYGLLVHDADDLLAQGGRRLVAALESLRNEKKIQKIGVSLYEAAQVERVLDLFVPDIIQLPINVFDQRLIHDGTLRRLAATGVEIHARSIFLQGLLLMDLNLLPTYFSPWIDRLKNWHQTCSRLSVLPQHAALSWACSISEISYVIVGVQDAHQLKQILEKSKEINIDDFKSMVCSDRELLNPRLWVV